MAVHTWQSSVSRKAPHVDAEFQRHYADYKAFTHGVRLVLAGSALMLLSLALFLL